jgi:hypothetical protein
VTEINKGPPYRSVICYNRFDLKKAIELSGVNSCVCMGIWPGKKTTDGFILNPGSYTTLSSPEEHKDIDSAESITVAFHPDTNAFTRLYYTPGAFAENQTMIMSQDKALYEYVKNSGLKFKSVIE